LFSVTEFPNSVAHKIARIFSPAFQSVVTIMLEADVAGDAIDRSMASGFELVWKIGLADERARHRKEVGIA
jgi:hypothetical protein